MRTKVKEVGKPKDKNKHSLQFGDLLILSLRIFRTRPARTLLTILGMGFGVGVVLFLVSLGYGLQKILLGNLASTQDSLVAVEAYFPAESKLKIDNLSLNKIAVLPEVEEISEVSEFPAEARGTSTSGYLIARVIDESYLRLSGLNVSKESEGKVVLSKTALSVLGYEPTEASVGKVVSIDLVLPKIIAGQDSGEVEVVRMNNLIIGGIINDEGEAPLILLPQTIATSTPAFYEKVFIKAKNLESIQPLRDKLIDMGLAVSARIDLVNQAQKILTVITIILGIFGLASLVVSAIGMFNTMIIGFLERTYEVGIMKAIGAKNSDIRNLFLVESLVFGFLGGIGGIAIGIGCADLFNFGLNMIAKNLGGKSVDLFVRPWWFLITIVVVSSLIGVISGIIPAFRAAKLSPKQAFVKK